MYISRHRDKSSYDNVTVLVTTLVPHTLHFVPVTYLSVIMSFWSSWCRILFLCKNK